MKSYVEFVAAPTSDTAGTTLLLHFDERRYLIGNISEGTQRACVERRRRLNHLTDILFTGKTEWANTGGLLGLMLTLAGSASSSSSGTLVLEHQKIAELEKRLETPSNTRHADTIRAQIQRCYDRIARVPEKAQRTAGINVHGGPNLTRTLATGRTFMYRKEMSIFFHEYGIDGETGEGKEGPTEPTWKDDHVNVWALPIFPSTPATAEPKHGCKRNFNEFQEPTVPSKRIQDHDASQLRENQVVCQRVVDEMFHSDWSQDVLEEVSLADVHESTTLFVHNPDTGKVEEFTRPDPEEGGVQPDIKVLARKPWPGAEIKSLPPSSPSECSMSYIIRSHDVRGKFDARKATKLNVRKGPDYGALVNGQSVTSLDGKTITPEMVLEPSRPGKGIAIIELPTVDYVENLVSRPEWESDQVFKGLKMFVWKIGPGVGEHPRLREFIARMSQCEHIFSSREHCANPLVFKGAGKTTTQFGQIDGERYQTPFHDNDVPPPMSVSGENGRQNVRAARTGMVVQMEPEFGVDVDRVQEPPLDIEHAKANGVDGVRQMAKGVRRTLRGSEFQKQLEDFRQTLPEGDAEIITLGTGSSMPSRYRNIAGTLVRIPGHGSYLLDCGEGTLGQLERTLGPSELQEVLRDLKMIWISHLHADHHLGIVSVIKAWYKAVFATTPPPAELKSESANVLEVVNEKRLFVASSRHMLDWLSEYASIENYGYDKIVLLEAASHTDSSGEPETYVYYNDRDANGQVISDSNGHTRGKRIYLNHAMSPLSAAIRRATGLSSLLSVPVPHCQGARAVSLVFPSGHKISFSGDCRPSDLFAAIGKDSTVLIHEATFDDQMIADAISKRHSTVGEALSVAKQMQAKVVVLTHFSQRYRELPTVNKGRSRSRSRSPGQKRTEIDPSSIPVAVRDIPPTDDSVVPSTWNPPDKDLPLDAPVLLAFDHMRLRVRDALIAEQYMPIFRHHLLHGEVEE